MTDHKRLQAMVGARHDLTAEERLAVEIHLEDCGSCRNLAQEYARQDIFLRALPLPAPSPAVRQGVFDRIEKRPSRWRGLIRRGSLFGAPAAATLLAVILVARIHDPGGPSPTYFAGASSLGPQHRAAPMQVDSASQRGQANAPEAIPASPMIPPGPQRSDTVSHGARLTLIVRRADYPQNALVRVTIEVQNRSRDLIWVHAAALGECQSFHAVAETINALGNVVTPLPRLFIPSCPALFPGRRVPGFLRPGQTLRTSQWVVLLANRVRARTDITRYSVCDPRLRSSCDGQEEEISGRPLTFVLLPGKSPRIVVSGLPPSSFRLLPAARRPTLLWYQGFFACGPGPGQYWGVTEGGVGTTIRPGNSAPLGGLSDCNSRKSVLYLVAGHPGQPVAFFTERHGQVRP